MSWPRLLVPFALYGLALVARAATAAGIHFPVPEDSAYYVAAAQNLATGRGLTVDVIWSYATPPLVLPRPAFDLWQPLASFLFAPLMAIGGPRLSAAQAANVALGSLSAPLAWAFGARAADELGLSAVRATAVAFSAGLLVVFAPLLVLQSAEPDSSAPFTVLALAACRLIPDAVAERGRAVRSRALLGLVLGLAYLARQEAIWVGLAYLVIALARRDERGAGAALRSAVPVAAVAAVVAAPWLGRQALTWQGSPFGQALENAWLVRQTDIFAWTTRPSATAYLALGPTTLLGQRIDAFVADLALLVATGFPATLLGLGSGVLRPRLIAAPVLRGLAVACVLIFVVGIVVFPVVSPAGLWAHGAGPAIVLLAVLGALGLDALVARLIVFRGWRSPDGPLSRVTFVAPFIVIAWAVPLTILAAQLEQERAAATAAEYGALSAAAGKWDVPSTAVLVTDHPMWVSAALDRPAVALPREAPAAVVDLARHFGAAAIVVRDGDLVGQVADLAGYRDPSGAACFSELPAPPPFRALAFTCP